MSITIGWPEALMVLLISYMAFTKVCSYHEDGKMVELYWTAGWWFVMLFLLWWGGFFA